MKQFVLVACLVAISAAEYAGPQHLPVIGANGVPVDTAEVQNAKVAHFAHKVEATARNGDAYPYYHPYGYAYGFNQAYVTPVAVNGVPQETPEVVAAKANHFAAHAEAIARTAYPYGYAYNPTYYPAVASPVVPQETPEVVAAKANHFAAHAEAIARTAYPYGYAYNPYYYPAVASSAVAAPVVPQETPEVVAARANHFAAHAEALARSAYHH